MSEATTARSRVLLPLACTAVALSAWLVAAALHLPADVTLLGEPQDATLQESRGGNARFSWELPFHVEDPEAARVDVSNEDAPAVRGVETWVEMRLNGARAFAFEYGGSQPNTVAWSRLPPEPAQLDLRALRAGANELEVTANGTLRPARSAGEITMTAGPLQLSVEYDKVAALVGPGIFLSAGGGAVAGVLIQARRRA